MVTALSSCYSSLPALDSSLCSLSGFVQILSSCRSALSLLGHVSFQRKFSSRVGSRCFFCPVFCWISPEHCWSVLPHCKSASFLLCSVEQTVPAQLIAAGTSPAPPKAFASALFVKVEIHLTPILILRVPCFQWREPNSVDSPSLYTLGTN